MSMRVAKTICVAVSLTAVIWLTGGCSNEPGNTENELAHTSGVGSQTSASFTTDGSWKIEWSYDCSNLGRPSTFLVAPDPESKPLDGRLVPTVNENGTDGRGTLLVGDRLGKWTIRVLTDCRSEVTARRGS